jgi:ribonuclease P protein component
MPTAVQGPPVGAARPQLWRITDRRTFQALRQRGQRARRGPLTVTWLPPIPGEPPTPARAGFALGKATGGAVLRNRVRRRLRAALRQLATEGRLPAGTYLLGGSASLATLPWPELVALVAATIDEARR